ncbi:UNKNOWN [Stylonychia lemnae]|uniref:Small ribosomal subunit protein mS41 SAM domain-containing protein n=1 Tax=Stylonychia lemnae TaxID=5949 RepID=A0A078AJU1_STYLE|nr:UNKNOWN [Stylonychia lemnae]|eukprot:CDW81732.1 UNKNOWN [Stylonychia lemnae]
MMLRNIIQTQLRLTQQHILCAQPSSLLYYTTLRSFTGKTESGFRFKTPKMRMKHVNPIFPPPGQNLMIPKDLTPEVYLKSIGGDCGEYADKFETIDEVFNLDSV